MHIRSLRSQSRCKVIIFFKDLGSREFLLAIMEKLLWLCLGFLFNHGAVTISHHELFKQGALPKTMLSPTFMCQRLMKEKPPLSRKAPLQKLAHMCENHIIFVKGLFTLVFAFFWGPIIILDPNLSP